MRACARARLNPPEYRESTARTARPLSEICRRSAYLSNRNSSTLNLSTRPLALRSRAARRKRQKMLTKYSRRARARHVGQENPPRRRDPPGLSAVQSLYISRKQIPLIEYRMSRVARICESPSPSSRHPTGRGGNVTTNVALGERATGIVFY